MKANKKAFTLTEVLVAMVILAVVAAAALSMYYSTHSNNKSASDGYYLEMAQISAIEELQNRIDDGEYIEDFISIETEAGRFRLTTYFEIEVVRSKTGKLFYTVEATTKIGGSSNRKITSRVVLAKQEGNLYDGQQEISPTPPPDQPIFIIGLKVLTPPNKLEYIHGEEIDTTGLTLEILYNDGNREVIDSGYTYAPSHADYANPALRVECTKGGYTASAYIPLTVHRLLTNLALIREQDQKDYSVGEPFNPDGLILKATYNDGNSELITSGYVCGDITSFSPGSATNTISFTHRVDTLSVKVPVNIYKVVTVVPSQKGILTYNANPQSPEWNNYNSQDLQISGTTSATNAGEYPAAFTPRDYCWWADRTRDIKTVVWKINKAEQKISVPSDLFSVHVGKTTSIAATVTGVNGGTPIGNVSYASGNPSVATVDAATGSVNAIKHGSCFMTISVTGTVNYLPATKTVTVSVGDHNYSITYSVDVEPTCTSVGSKSFHCTEPDCPATTGTVSIPMTPHTYGDWVTDTDATCTSAGSKHRSCTVCGAREDGSIARLGHSWDTSYLESSATCTEPAYYYDRCSRCGAYSSSYAYGSSLGHDWKAQLKTAATCTSPAYYYDRCSRCGLTGGSYSYGVSLGHEWGKWSVAWASSCTGQGTEVRTCSRCDASQSRSIPALGHKYGSYWAWSYYNSTQHVRTRTCSRCSVKDSSYSAHYSTDSTRLCRGCGSYF